MSQVMSEAGRQGTTGLSQFMRRFGRRSWGKGQQSLLAMTATSTIFSRSLGRILVAQNLAIGSCPLRYEAE
jgi:hypothetical protein